MRRPAMYFAGLLLATGASLALAAPASAAGSYCPGVGGWYPGAIDGIGGIGSGLGYGAGLGYGGGLGYGNGFYNGGIGNDRLYSSTRQVGLVNVNDGPFGF
ncbi:hypothetical protein [Actinoplanes regularis]|uniref:hypothetical protein n=1 Tax=Actinoplanes regularis TaxID=52697 RepID=UPI002552680A|nr:hypothetical protein [Actinoplanes regularis]GLW28092.1 hypothetical protein Areg01_10320 [Actinoplanes regularis]